MMHLDFAFQSPNLPIFDFIFAALLMAPSIVYVILYLIPLAAIIGWTVINAKEDSPALRYMNQNAVLNIAILLCFFWILKKRELKLFSTERRLVV